MSGLAWGTGHLWASQLWPQRQGYVRTGQTHWNDMVGVGGCGGHDEPVPIEEGLLVQKEREQGVFILSLLKGARLCKK